MKLITLILLASAMFNTSRAAQRPPEPEQEQGQYYIGGEVERPGVYVLSARKIKITQALISAGVNRDEAQDLHVSITRNAHPVLTDELLADLFDGKIEDLYVEPDDQIIVKHAKAGAATQPATQPK